MDLLSKKAPLSESNFGVLENPSRPQFNFNRFQGWLRQQLPRVITLDHQPVYKNAGEDDQAVKNRIDDAFRGWRQKNIRFAQVCADPIFNDFRRYLIPVAKQNRVRVIWQWKEFKDDGADASDLVLGTLLKKAYEQAGVMAGKVLDNPSGIGGMPVYTMPLPLPAKRRGRKKR
jgi:hypothetical protein